MTRAGTTPAGVESITIPARVTAVLPAAILFDLSTRTFPLNADGTFKAIHPVDQQVALALGIQQGAIGSYTKLGNKLRAIKRGGGPQLISQVQDAVRQAVAAIVARNDILVTEVAVFTPVRGQITLSFTYVNLRLSPTALPNTIRAGF
jgi:hypothetical protein